MISITGRGSFKNSKRFFDRVLRGDIFRALDTYGEMGVRALASVTPQRSGTTASSWSYVSKRERGVYSVEWHNSNVISGGTPLVILLQYGHGTGTGGYVRGIDFINPSIRPIFDHIAESVWKVVTSA